MMYVEALFFIDLIVNFFVSYDETMSHRRVKNVESVGLLTIRKSEESMGFVDRHSPYHGATDLRRQRVHSLRGRSRR